MEPRRKRNSGKINLTVSIIVHALIFVGLAYVAARQGILGKNVMLAVRLERDKKVEPPKPEELAPPPPVETPKEVPKAVIPDNTPKPPPPALSQSTKTVVAPAPAIRPTFTFSGGASLSTGTANEVYRDRLQNALKQQWHRPEGIDDAAFVAEVELSLDGAGMVKDHRLAKGSGNIVWDDSVKAALAASKQLFPTAPAGFPRKFTVRFDTESQETLGTLQLSSISPVAP